MGKSKKSSFDFYISGLVLSPLLRHVHNGSGVARIAVWVLLPMSVTIWSLLLLLSASLSPLLLILHGLLSIVGGDMVQKQKADGTWAPVNEFSRAFRDGSWRHKSHGFAKAALGATGGAMLGALIQFLLGLGLFVSIAPHYALMLFGRKGFFRPEFDRMLFVFNRTVFDRK